MRGRPNPVEALATLIRPAEASERRANFRQAIAALGQGQGALGPPPLDGIAPDVLTRVVGIALDAGLFDDLDWIAPGPAAVALYELSAALPQGRPRRELGRRVLSRLYEGTASTFASVATRMALSSGRALDAAPIRARVALIFDLPVGSSVNADALALTLVTRRELRERWLDRAQSGNLPARRLAAKLLEHAAREAVLRAQQGDSHPKDLLLGEPLRTSFGTLLADREPLVWRHAAVARGLLAAVDGDLREEIAVGLDPSLSPTEWRRAAVSLVGTLPSDPEGALRTCRRLLESSIVELDPGILGTMVLGLPRAIEAEPGAAEALLAALAATKRPDVAEAVATLLGDLAGHTFGQSAARLLRETLIARAQSQGSVLRGVAELTIRMLDRDQDETREIAPAVRRALAAYENLGARAAHELATNALAVAHRAMDFIAAHDPHDLRVSPYVVGALADLDSSALESPRLSNLLLLGHGPGDSDVSISGSDRLYDRLGRWLLEAESSAPHSEHVNAAARAEQRRLKALLHLVDVEGARSDDDPAGRERVRRAIQVLLRRLASGPEAPVHRIACATLARSFDAAVREGLFEPSDLLLAVLHFLSDLPSFESLAEASTNPDMRAVLSAYVDFLNLHSDPIDDADPHFEPKSAPGEAPSRVAERVLALSRGLGAGGSYRGEALRRIVQRLGRALEAITGAQGQTELIDESDSGTDLLSQVGHALDALHRLTSGALRRVIDDDPMAVSVVADVPSLSTLVEAAVRSSSRADPEQLAAAIKELVIDLPVALAIAVSHVLERIALLPAVADPSSRGLPRPRPRSSLPDWLLPQKTIGAFHVLSALGSGGASSVFLVRRIEERKNSRADAFALKVPAYDPTTARSLSEQEFLQLFREEASALLSLPQHANLARFVTFDLGARPKPILVMELIRGFGLDRLIRGRSLSTERALRYLDGILAGLEAMHAAGVGHLDLKPSNVILRAGETPVLVDFGLSGRHLRPGCGTLAYCAPEVLGHFPADCAPSPLPADIYAFGCLAYEALTGEPLFEADDESSILSLHVAHDGWPARLAEFSRVSECSQCALLLAACLRQDPRKRPTATQAREVLARSSRPLRERPWPLTMAPSATELSA